MTRSEARAAGLKYYDEGRRSCRLNHPTKRWVTTGKCFFCARSYERERRRADPATKTAQTREWRRQNPDKVKASNAKRDPAMLRALAKRWRMENPEKYATQIARRDKTRQKEISAKYRAKHAKPRPPKDPVAEALRKRHTARAAAKAWRAANPDKAAALRARYREKHREKLRQKNADYRKANPTDPLVRRVREARRRARKQQNGGSYTKADVMVLFQRQRGRCAYCRGCIKKKFHVDHIIPLALGGSNGPENIQLLCPPCNHKKHTKHPIDFARSLGLLL